MTNYQKYRGKCKEMAEALSTNNPDLTLVRGHYWCPIWNRKEEHWWCINKKGTIIDPTSKQFPSSGHGDYIPFDGIVSCEECGKDIPESEIILMGRYPTCSNNCAMRLVGL